MRASVYDVAVKNHITEGSMKYPYQVNSLSHTVITDPDNASSVMDQMKTAGDQYRLNWSRLYEASQQRSATPQDRPTSLKAADKCKTLWTEAHQCLQEGRTLRSINPSITEGLPLTSPLASIHVISSSGVAPCAPASTMEDDFRFISIFEDDPSPETMFTRILLRDGLLTAITTLMLETLGTKIQFDMGAVKHHASQGYSVCELHQGKFPLVRDLYPALLSFKHQQLRYMVQARGQFIKYGHDKHIERKGVMLYKESPLSHEHLFGITRLCLCGAIKLQEKIWHSRHEFRPNYEHTSYIEEANFIRRKCKTFLPTSSDAAESALVPKQTTSSGASVSALAPKQNAKAQAKQTPPRPSWAELKRIPTTPPTRMGWLEDPMMFGKGVSEGYVRGAGMIAFRYALSPVLMSLQDQILLVRAKTSGWGFPKGGMKSHRKGEPEETIFMNGCRECSQETSIDLKRFILLKNSFLDEAHAQCSYMLAVCLYPTPQCVDFQKGKIGWKPLNEDPHDKNPVVEARWMDVRTLLEAVVHPKGPPTNNNRVELLKKARWHVKESRLKVQSFPSKYVPGANTLLVLEDDEFHTRFLPMEWIYPSLSKPAYKPRSSNAHAHTTQPAYSAAHTMTSSSGKCACPRCQGTGEVPSFDTTEWLAFISGIETHKRSQSLVQVRDPPDPVSTKT